MAVTVTKATLADVAYRTALLLGLQDDSVTTFQVIESSPFTNANVERAVRLADSDLALAIVNAFDHPFRNTFFGTVTDITASGSEMPVAVADHSRVEILPAEDSDPSEWQNGRLARNVRHVTRCKEHPDIFGDGVDLYFIEHGVIYFNAFKARITQPTVEISSGADLLCPAVYTDAIVGKAAAKLYQNGADMSQREFYFRQAEIFEAKVLGNLDMPKPERFQQLN